MVSFLIRKVKIKVEVQGKKLTNFEVSLIIHFL